jgi:hypothetical protein
MEPQFTLVHSITKGQVRASIWRGECFDDEGLRSNVWYEYTLSEPSGTRDDPRYWRDYFMAQTEAEKFLAGLHEDAMKAEKVYLATAAA